MPMQEGGEDETSAPFAESRPEDGSRHRQKYCPGSGLREMRWRRGGDLLGSSCHTPGSQAGDSML